MNPYLQYFLGLREFRYTAPFDASMLTRFRHRISGEMLAWVNDRVIGRPQPEDSRNDDDSKGGSDGSGGTGGGREETHEKTAPGSASTELAPANEGTMILDATCAPQNIRYPTDTSLLNEARQNAEEIIDALHEICLTGGKKPRTYREKARREYNSFSKSRRKTGKMIRKIRGKLLNYLARDLTAINRILAEHPDRDCLGEALSSRQVERLTVIVAVYEQQRTMHEGGLRSVPNRIVSLSQYWVRPIVRGKQRAEVEFGSKVEMSVVNGYPRVEEIRWNAFNEGGTLIDSAESFRRAYGHYPARVLADRIFRTRENLRYCKGHGIHMSGPMLGKPPTGEALRRQQLKEEWLESGERGEIERSFGVGKRRDSLGRIMMKLRDTSEVAVRVVVLAMNLWRKLRLLSRLLWDLLNDCFEALRLSLNSASFVLPRSR